MAPDVRSLQARLDRLRVAAANRDTRMAQVRAVREGRMSEVAPDLFPMSGPWQEPIVANMIDVAARDVAEMVAPLPAFNCTSGGMVSESDRRRAGVLTKLVNGYVAGSQLQVQMYNAADWFVTYGFVPGRVEADYETNMPRIRLLDPAGCYYEKDRFNRVKSFFQVVTVPADRLIALWPEWAGKVREVGAQTVQVTFFHDADWDACWWSWSSVVKPTLLAATRNPVGECLVRVAERPSGSEGTRGQFDDVLFVQLAKSRMALLALQAANDSVNAPLVVPNDVPDVPLGPGATIRTANPAGVRRAALELPPAAFAEQSQLERELQLGSRFPQVRTGEVDGSTVTGKGVQALLGGYDAQIRAAQAIFAPFLSDLTELCLQLDEKVWGSREKTLRGAVSGTSFELKYRPSKVIDGQWSVDVRYGLMAGLDPNRWLVFALQARAEKMFSRDFMRREMPVEIDVEAEARKIDVEDLEEAAKQALMGYAQSIPALAAQGQDPSGPLQALSQVIAGRRKGKDLADLVVEAFTPKEPDKPAGMTPDDVAQMAAEGAGPPAPGMPPGGGGVPPGMMDNGMMQGVAPGQQGMAPGGMPDLQTMLASFNSRGPNLSAGVQRKVAI